MSGPPNGRNGYANGYYAQEHSNRYEENHPDVSPIEESGEWRAEGYDGFANDNVSAPGHHEWHNPSRRGEPDTDTYNNHTRSRFEERSSDLDNGSRSREHNALDHYNGRSQWNGLGSRQIEGQ